VVRNIRKERFLTFLSVIGIALGVGLFTGVKVATDRAVIAFEANIQGINPYANHEVVDSAGIDFSENIYGEVRRIEENTFPVIKVNAFLPDLSEAIEINGVDTVRVVSFLKLSMTGSYGMAPDLPGAGGIMVTRAFADRHGLKKGDKISAHVYSRAHRLEITEIISLPDLPRNATFMDIGDFQEFLGKIGTITKLDIRTDAVTAREIAGILPANLVVVEKQAVVRNQESFVASFKYNLQFVSLIAVLVGVFLLYNTIFITVIKRRGEIGILRGLGTGKWTTVLLFTAQGMLLGLVGSLLGVLLGQLFAYFSVVAVEKTISTIYRTISVSDYFINGYDVLKSLVLGLAVSFLASLVPALESARVRPNESAREGAMEQRYRRYQRFLVWIGLILIVLGAWSAYLDYRYTPLEFPYLAYGGILFFILGCTFCAPFYLFLFLKVIEKPVNRFFRGTGKITVNDIEGSLYRFSIALMSVAISSSLIVALVTSIHSMRSSLQEWINTYMVADVYIKPASCTSNYCFHPLPAKVVEVVKGFPEVESLGRFRALELDYMGRKVIAGFGSTEVWTKYGDPQYLDGTAKSRLNQLEATREVSISEYLRVKYGLQVGDILKIKTPRGEARFTINNTATSFSTTSGFIYFDRRWLKTMWGLDDETQLTLYLKKGQDVPAFVRKLKDRLLPGYSLEIVNNQELREQILVIFNRSFAVTYAIELIAILVSLIGVINTLLILVFERKREISILRYLGGSWGQIKGIMVLSAGLVGMAGILLGILMGPFMSLVIIHVINKISFGWEVAFRAPYGLLALLTTILFLTTVAAGFLPARIVRRVDPKAFVSFE
jgi:putative ABC transport system permease protein